MYTMIHNQHITNKLYHSIPSLSRGRYIFMDKNRKKKKLKRQQERRAKKESEVKDLADKFNQMMKDAGIKKKVNRSELMREYNKIQRDSVATAVVYCTVCTLYAMHKMFGFGKVRLIRLAAEMTVRVNNVATVDRSIPQMAEDLKYDTGINTSDYDWNFVYDPELKPAKKAELECIAMNIPYVLNIPMYAVHMGFNFKHKRMQKLCRVVVDMLRYCFESDKLDYYIEELNKTGFYINKNGNFGVDGITDEEKATLKRRIKMSGGDILNAKRKD